MFGGDPPLAPVSEGANAGCGQTESSLETHRIDAKHRRFGPPRAARLGIIVDIGPRGDARACRVFAGKCKNANHNGAEMNTRNQDQPDRLHRRTFWIDPADLLRFAKMPAAFAPLVLPQEAID